MSTPRLLLCSLVLAITSASAQSADAPPTVATAAAPAPAPAPAPADTPLTSFPYTPGLDVSAMDRSANPCEDFYQYTCGGWMKNNPIPPDQAKWSVYGKLYQDNQRFLWGILDGLAKDTAHRNPTQAQIGDFFAACMNEEAVDKLGATPANPYLASIDALADRKELPALLARLQLSLSGRAFLFSFGSQQDYADASAVIAGAGAGGLSLPDRDYYLKDDDKSKTLRAQYLAHVQRMFELLGDSPALAAQEAARVMTVETALAQASLTRVERRDPHKLFHKMDRQALAALTPHFDWQPFLEGMGVGDVQVFNVSEPAFLQAVDARIADADLPALKSYLRWHVLHAQAPYLSHAFVDANFDFFSKTLRGVPQLQPRWKRCVGLVDNELGEALGQEFVARAFSPELKERTLHMTTQIEQAMADDIKGLDWMDEETKARALEKLHAIVNKIGYPDRWRDYSSVHVDRNDFIGNVERADRFEAKRQLAKIGQPLDRAEWGMTPPTVNAYFDPQMNDINFPAGVLQPPLYDPKMDDAPNYGNTGGTIGHELTHGFDDEGRQFDAQGNLKDWWSELSAKNFVSRASCIVDQYAGYTIVDQIKINSKLTQGEDIADLGGLMLAMVAWKAETAGKQLADRDGLTPEQRFFVGYAQWACENNRPENLRVDAATNPHSPGRYRVNGLMVNMPEFQQAFKCKTGDAMSPKTRCRVW
jgi:endothelin-converting enzyme/putative endopeptidase